MNAKNDDHTISLHLLPTTSLENVNHINFGVSQEANIDVSQYTNKGERGDVHFSCLESLRGESKLMTLGNLSCTPGRHWQPWGGGLHPRVKWCAAHFALGCSLPPSTKKGGPL